MQFSVSRRRLGSTCAHFLNGNRSSLRQRKHSPAVPLQRKPLRVEQSDLDGAQHHRGETVDRSGSLISHVLNCGRTKPAFCLCSCLKLLVPKAFSVCADCLQSGDIDIVNTTAKDTCRLKFSPYSYFSRDVPRKVSLPSFGSAKTRREGEHRAARGFGFIRFCCTDSFYLWRRTADHVLQLDCRDLILKARTLSPLNRKVLPRTP